MASRNRVIYQSEGIIVSETATSMAEGGHQQLYRVQSANYSYTINRQDVNQYGELARIDSLVLEPPTVSVDFSYYLTDGFNERVLGFYVQTGIAAQGNFASGHLTAGSGVNVYIMTDPEGEDLNADTAGGAAVAAAGTVIGIGNCYLSDYSIDLSVGALPTASVTMEGSNVRSSAGNAIKNPSINQSDGTEYTGANVAATTFSTSGMGVTTSALRPGDIVMGLTAFDGDTISDLSATEGIHIQSATISVPLSRTPLDRLGSKFAFARTVDFPVVTTLSVSAIMNEVDAVQLADKLEAPERNVSIIMKTPTAGTGIRWDFKGALVEGESWSSSIGSNKAVDLTFSAQIGGPNDQDDGVYMSGVNVSGIFS